MLLHYLGNTEQTKYALKWTINVNKLEIRSHKNLITVVWANEVHRLLTYYGTFCYQTRRWWHVRVSTGQCTSTSVRKTIKLLERETQTSSLQICGPPTAITSIWSITSSGGHATAGLIRRRSKMWMNSRSDWLKFGLVWSRTFLTLLFNARRNRLRACVCSKGRHIEHWL